MRPQYCDLLLSDAECAAWRCQLALSLQMAPSELSTAESERKRKLQRACNYVTERAMKWFEWRVPSDSLLEIALEHLTLGRTALYGVLLSQSDLPNLESQIASHLTDAVDGLREAGALNHVPKGLLTQAWQRQLMGNAPGAVLALDEAWEIAERGPMPLY